MKIKFKKKKLLLELIAGLVWIALGVINIIEMEHIHWSKYGYFVFGLIYLSLFLYNFTNQYLTIENGTLQKNGLFSFRKKINLNDIIEIKTVAGDYTLLTDTTKLKIQVELIADDSLLELNRILSELDLPTDKTPFQNTTIE
jgi:hypothetical protein